MNELCEYQNAQCNGKKKKLPSLCSEPLPRHIQNTVYRLTILHLYQLAVSVNEQYGCSLNGRLIVLADARNAVLRTPQHLYREGFDGRQSGNDVKLTISFNPEPTLRMCGPRHPLSHTGSVAYCFSTGANYIYITVFLLFCMGLKPDLSL